MTPYSLTLTLWLPAAHSVFWFVWLLLAAGAALYSAAHQVQYLDRERMVAAYSDPPWFAILYFIVCLLCPPLIIWWIWHCRR